MSIQSQSELFLWEAFDLITGTTIPGVLYGITFILYCLCARLSYLQLQERDKRQQARFTLAYTSFLFLCITTFLATGTRMGLLAYVNHANDFPGGPLEYEFSGDPTFSSYELANGFIVVTVEAMTMAIQIWRLWIVWSGTQFSLAVTILPLVVLFAYIGLGVFVDIVPGFLPPERLGISAARFRKIDTSTFSVLSTFTILVTGLVTARLLLVRRRHKKLLGMSDTSSPYMNIVAMLIESYALDSVWSIGAAISAGVGSFSYILFSSNDPFIKVIAYFLVVYRVATGRGWTKETERKLTSLQWNHSTQTTTEVSGIRSQVPATVTVIAIGSPPISNSGSVV